jgi:two-component system nitrogen regulation response regulator GlnG
MSGLLLIDDDAAQFETQVRQAFPAPGHLAQVVEEALEIGRQLRGPSLGADPAAAPETGGQLVGTCPAMRQVYKEIGLVAEQDFPVIITGESGAGKELIARAIHEHSN